MFIMQIIVNVEKEEQVDSSDLSGTFWIDASDVKNFTLTLYAVKVRAKNETTEYCLKNSEISHQQGTEADKLDLVQETEEGRYVRKKYDPISYAEVARGNVNIIRFHTFQV